MYRPSMYEKHYESLKNFIDIFNSCNVFSYIQIIPKKDESLIDDGQIINENTMQTIKFAWEYREKYFRNCVFKFDSLGQYERKIRNPTIQISIQSDSTETGIAVAWHEDFLLENKISLYLSTDHIDEFGTVRYTRSFKIYPYSDIKDFKAMIDQAFKNGTYNKNSF